jgi:hypothetical protein
MGSAVMRPASFCTLCVLLASNVAASAAQGPRPPAPTAPASRPFVVIGCLSREARPPASTNRSAEAAVFTLTDGRGDQPSVYRLDGDAASLSTHVGHTVEVSGPLSRAGGSNTPPFVLKVDKLTWIATTCRKTP